MHIVHVEDYFDPTAGYQINELLIASNILKIQTTLITSNDMSPFHKKVDKKKDIEFEKKYSIKIIRLPVKFKISSRVYLKNLFATISSLKPDMVYMHGIGDFRDLVLFKKKRPYLIYRDCHMSWSGSKNRFNNLYFKLFRNTLAKLINKTNKYDGIFSLGVEETEYLRTIGINTSKIIDLPHGFNKATMFYDSVEAIKLRNELNMKENDTIISYIGKFNFSKSPHLIFDIFEKLDSEFIDKYSVKLLFAGPKDKDYMSFFNEKLDSFKFKDKVKILDAIPFNELYKYYSACNICIFPKETTLSSIHAQVCNCKVVMENHLSNKERVVDNENLFELDNLHQASIIVRKLISEKPDFTDEKNQLKTREYSNQMKTILSYYNKSTGIDN